MSDTVIALEGVSKTFPVYARRLDIFASVLLGQKRYDDFWALREVSFSIQDGQRLGVIGANGSGKTTLLHLITGSLLPSTGTVKVNGRVSAMLSLTSSLSPGESGLSNIRFNLLLQGCDPKLIPVLTEEIVEFTELGQFIHAPVRTYSTGMNARLAFAIATAQQPDILVVDEILSVGDAYFNGKATQRMLELTQRGRALLFVSHSMASVRMLCDTVLWMENGSVRAFGPAEAVLAQYEADYRQSEDDATRAGNRERRDRMAAMLAADEVREDEERIRLVSENPKRQIRDTYFVRRVAIHAEGTGNTEIPMSAIAPGDAAAGYLDLTGSGWGRLYGRGGSDCRVLEARTGRSKGGHVLLRRQGEAIASSGIRVTAEVSSLGNRDPLTIEYANPESGRWEAAAELHREAMEDGWERLVAEIRFSKADVASRRSLARRIREDARPAIEILGVAGFRDGQPVLSVREREPFSIHVGFHVRERLPAFDIGIRVTRSDGVHMFWQSSGLAGANYSNLTGDRTARFTFDPNCFPEGVYAVSAFAGNGWNHPDNFPYTEIIDRKVDACRFSITPEYPGVNFGCVNVRIPVDLI